MVNVFLPLLLLERGAELWHICLFYIGYALCKLVINYPSIVLVERRHPGFGLGVALLASAVYLILLEAYVSGAGDWLIVLAPAALAWMNAFLWNSQHIHISRALDVARRGRDMALLNTFTHLAILAAPLIGGILITLVGQQALLYAAIGIIVVAAFPARSARHLPRFPTPSLGGSRPAPARDLLANLSFNAHNMVHFLVWPVYLAVVIGEFAAIGLLTAAAEAVGLMLLMVAGKRGDRGATRRVLVEGTAATMVLHLARLAAITPVAITLIGGAVTAAIGYQQIPWVSTYYAHARRRGAGYVLWMEMAGDIGYVLAWSALLITALVWATPQAFFITAFLLAAFFTLGCLLIDKEHKGDVPGSVHTPEGSMRASRT
jgi:hypothetical protein